MKTLLKFGIALIMFGLLLSALGVGIIRSHAVKPIPQTMSASASASVSAAATETETATKASAITSSPAKP
jgi:hypothetical protein